MYHDGKDEILNSAIASLRKGESLAHVLETVSDPHMRSLITLASVGMAIPTKEVPVPARQYKFMSVSPEPVRLWLRILPFMRMAIMPLSLVLVLMAGWVSKLTIDSTPGRSLFTVKNAYEQLQIRLAKTPEEKANLQLTLTQRRLADAESAIKDDQDPAAKEAALIELATQTQSTLQSVKETKGQSDTVPAPIAARLSTIADQQQALLKDLPSSEQTPLITTTPKTAAQSAPATKGSELIATVHEETLSALGTDNTKLITLTDTITAVKDKTFTLGKDTTVTLKGSSIIKEAGIPATIDKIAVGAKVTVKAAKGTDDQLRAVEVVILEEAKVVKSTPKLTPKPAEAAVEPDPNTATSGFIPETPAPQYVP